MSSARKQPVAFSLIVVIRSLASTQAPAQLVAVGEGDRAGFWLGFALPYRQLWPSRGDTLSMAGAIAVEDDGIPNALNVLTLRCPGNPRTAGVPVPTDGLALIPGISLGGLSNHQVTEWCAWDIKAGNSSVRTTAPHVLSGYGIALTRMVALKERTTRPENAVSSAHRPLSCRRFPTPILHPEMDELRKVAVPSFLTIWSNTNTSSWEPFFEHSLAPRQAVSWWIGYEFWASWTCTYWRLRYAWVQGRSIQRRVTPGQSYRETEPPQLQACSDGARDVVSIAANAEEQPVNRNEELKLATPPTRMSAEYELRESLGWLSNLRWIAGAAVVAATWITCSILGLGIPTVPLTAIGAGICLYNAGFKWWLSRIQRGSSGADAQPHTLARLQIAADWIAIAALAHYSGGIESPIILYYFFHTVLAALLLSDKDTYISAAVATLLIAGTALLEYWSILPHHHVNGLLPFELYRNPLYLVSTLFFFTSTIFVSAYLSTRITRRLRGREAEMIRLSSNLQRTYFQMETIYNNAQDVSSTLELQEVLDRLTRSTTNAMNLKGCTIRLLRETGTQLSLVSSYGLRDEYLKKGPLRVAQNPLVRQVLAGEIVAVSDVAADDRLQYPVEAAAEGIRATLTAPLEGRTGPLGIIRVYHDKANPFTEDDYHFLLAVASHGSVAIENAMTFEAMQNLEESKRKFVLLVTHELRSPIGVVRSLLNTMAEGYAGDLSDLQQDILDRAVRRTKFLQTLIDDLLDLAAAKTGLRVTKETEPVDLRVTLAQIVERYRVPASEQGVDLQVRISDGHPICVVATAEELDRAFTNLVSNAVKYTPEGGVVEITLEAQPDKAQLVVRDSGIGIPGEALPHLFEEFYRAPNAKARMKHGTGLGLVITKDIVTRYGGTIRVSSGVGEGTTVTVILPTVAASADRATSEVTTDAHQNARIT